GFWAESSRPQALDQGDRHGPDVAFNAGFRTDVRGKKQLAAAGKHLLLHRECPGFGPERAACRPAFDSDRSGALLLRRQMPVETDQTIAPDFFTPAIDLGNEIAGERQFALSPHERRRLDPNGSRFWIVSQVEAAALDGKRDIVHPRQT